MVKNADMLGPKWGKSSNHVNLLTMFRSRLSSPMDHILAELEVDIEIKNETSRIKNLRLRKSTISPEQSI